MTDVVVKEDNKKKKQESRIQGGEKREMQREGEQERGGDAESGVGVCLLTKSLKSMAVLMNISQEKLVPSSAGTDYKRD